MTAAVNQVTEPAAAVPTDSPAPPEKVKPKQLLRTVLAAVRPDDSTWRGFISRPMSVKEAWELSAVIDARRIPGDKKGFAGWWWYWSNRSDRLLLFASLLVVPTFLNKPLLWAAVRPTRRWGMYVVLFALYVILPAVAVGG